MKQIPAYPAGPNRDTLARNRMERDVQPDARSALPPPDLVDKIPLTARRVIILGCGDGTLGAEYRRRNPAAEIFGIERDPAMAERACAVLDRVYCLDLATSPLPR